MTITEIKTKINNIKQRPVPLVFTRVTGYYRAVQNFNDGKQSEFEDRLEYKIGT